MANPFSPSFGFKPRAFVARSTKAEYVADSLEDPGSPYRTTFITGIRGSGKTTFLNRIRDLKLEQADWIVVELGLDTHFMEYMIEDIELDKRIKGLKWKFPVKSVSTSLFGAGGSITLAEQDAKSIRRSLFELLELLASHQLKLLLVVDEVTPHPVFIEFLSWYQRWISRDLPIYLVAAGLPKLLLDVRESEGLTFLLRSTLIDLTTLDLHGIERSYRRYFKDRLDLETIRQMTQLTGGYTYAYQLYGYYMWQALDQDAWLLDVVTEQVQEILFTNVYRYLFQHLTKAEKAFVETMVEIQQDVVATKQIVERWNKSSNYVNQYRNRLIQQGLIYSPSYGKLAFQLPFVSEFRYSSYY